MNTNQRLDSLAMFEQVTAGRGAPRLTRGTTARLFREHRHLRRRPDRPDGSCPPHRSRPPPAPGSVARAGHLVDVSSTSNCAASLRSRNNDMQRVTNSINGVVDDLNQVIDSLDQVIVDLIDFIDEIELV